MSDIFLSYQRADEPRAELLIQIFQKLEWSSWRDNEIPTAARWEEIIQRELDAAKVVVVCWSKTAVNSEWVCKEAEHAIANRKYLPISFDGAQPPGDFAKFQATSLRNWRGGLDSYNLKLVLKAISSQLGRSTQPRNDQQSENDKTLGDVVDYFVLQRQRAMSWYILSACAFFYALAMWIATQQRGFNPGFLIDPRQVQGSVIALLLVSILLVSASRYLYLFAKSYPDEHWVRRVPSFGFSLPDPEKPFVRFQARLMLFLATAIPAASLVHFGRKVHTYGVVTRCGDSTAMIDYWRTAPSFSELFSHSYCIGETPQDAARGITFFPFYEPYLIVALVLCAWIMTARAVWAVWKPD